MGITPLVSVNENISAINYCEILGEGLLLSNILTNDLLYVLHSEDARTRIAAYTRDWFTHNHVTVMQLPRIYIR